MRPGHRLPYFWRHDYAWWPPTVEGVTEPIMRVDRCPCGVARQHQHSFEVVDQALGVRGPVGVEGELRACACGVAMVVERELWRISDFY